MDCPKCGKYLGGIWPMEDATKEENDKMFDSFFGGSAKSQCDDLDNCYYYNDDIKKELDTQRKEKWDEYLKEFEDE